MKRIFTLLAATLCLVAAMAQDRATTLANQLNDRNSHKVFVVAHRGDWRNAPENSLQAFKNCIDMGVDMVELDLKMTKDGQLVIMHDYTVDRTTTGHGKVEDLTFEQLRQFKLKSGHNSPTRHIIPTLEEALLLCKGKILVNIDKGYEYFKEAYAIAEKTGTTGQVVIKSGNTLDKVKKENGAVLDKVTYMPVVNFNKPGAEELLKAWTKVSPVAIECNFATYDDNTARMLNEVKKAGSKLWINSLWPSQNAGHDDDAAVEEHREDDCWGLILKQGALLIQTDRPALLIKYLNEKGYQH